MSMTADQYRKVKKECNDHIENASILMGTSIEAPIYVFTQGLKETLNIDYGRLLECRKGLKAGSRVTESYRNLMCENRRIYNEVLIYEKTYPYKVIRV